MWLTLFFESLQVKCNLSFVFKALKRGVIGSSHIVSFFPSKLSKLNIRVQSVIRVIAYGAKSAFEKFMMQSVT